MALTLYHNDNSSCSQKIRLALAEKKLDWESKHIQLRFGEQYNEEYLKVNPKGTVPTLSLGDDIIPESNVILEFLEDAYPEAPSLRPKTALGKARMRAWTKQCDEDVHSSIGAITYATVLRHTFANKTPEEREAMAAKAGKAKRDPAGRARMAELTRDGTSHPAFQNAILRLAKGFAEIEVALQNGPWLAGEEFSLADCAWLPYAKRMDDLGFMDKILGDSHPKVRDWFKRGQERPSWEVAMGGEWKVPPMMQMMKEKGEAELPRVEEILKNARQ
eukprot:TRINITY_DN33199_c0_g1_i1.p1 TRINITY_DN33199_c0_g1~~TRINITY_DN33199_c0_g1_i1.p1  ORF type:complete len:275 (-),score=21.45 TRINITY_DN33199_c0_g1_i1:49-873(-)